MDAEFRSRLAQLLMQMNQGPAAEEELKMALLLKPNEGKYHKLMAELLMQVSRPDEALLEYRLAAPLFPPDSPDFAEIKAKLDYLKAKLQTH